LEREEIRARAVSLIGSLLEAVKNFTLASRQKTLQLVSRLLKKRNKEEIIRIKKIQEGKILQTIKIQTLIFYSS